MSDVHGGRFVGADAAVREMSERIQAAFQARQPLRIVGGDTKSFYGRPVSGTTFKMAGYAGIVAYEPTELVITVKAGTPLGEIDQILERNAQMLGFEPPHCGRHSTIGGVVASGLSGPGRPWLGAVRDFVLGVETINGQGQLLRFGGQVMKNVAGYDVSRLMAGSLGTLGVITRVSLRVVPKPRCAATLSWGLAKSEAKARMLEWSRQPWPITAMAFDGTALRVRATGSEQALADAIERLSPDSSVSEDDYWNRLRDFKLPVFQARNASVWRLSLPPAAPDPEDIVPDLWDWGGAQRWLMNAADGATLQRHCASHGGHAGCFRSHEQTRSPDVFMQPDQALRGIFERLKRAFDPAGIFNPGRHFAWM